MNSKTISEHIKDQKQSNFIISPTEMFLGLRQGGLPGPSRVSSGPDRE